MKEFPGFIDFFISPVTGKNRISNLPDLPPDWIITGDANHHPCVSPAFLDLKIDVRYMGECLLEMKDAPFVMPHPHRLFPHAVALDQIDAGILWQQGGELSAAKLTQGKIWVGSTANQPEEQSTISVSNLPDLGVQTISVPNPLNPTTPWTFTGGDIWRGTSPWSRPAPSSALTLVEGDIALLNARFLLGEFILGDALVQPSWPKSQFLINLPDGILRKTGKILGTAVPGEDFVAVADGVVPNEERLPKWAANGQSFLTNSMIEIYDADLRGINSIDAVLVQASNSITSDQNIIARHSIESRELILYDYDDVHRYTQHVSLKGPASIPNNIAWVMPNAISTAGQVLADIGGVPLSLDRQLGFVNAAAHDATYILQTANDALPNAQSLQHLAPGSLLKVDTLGSGAIHEAVVQIDYPSIASVEAAQAAAESAATAASAAGIAAAAAQVTADSALLGVAALTATTTAQGLAIAGLTSKVDGIEGTPHEVVVEHGSHIRVGLSTNPIIKGEVITLPVGTYSDRPTNPRPGMIRFNTEIQL